MTDHLEVQTLEGMLHVSLENIGHAIKVHAIIDAPSEKLGPDWACHKVYGAPPKAKELAYAIRNAILEAIDNVEAS